MTAPQEAEWTTLRGASSRGETRPGARFTLVGTLKAVESDAFARDVREGLTAPAKHLSCAWFYDRQGSLLFEEICAQPEYYLTRAEREILETHAAEILDGVPPDVSLVELGSGSSVKTRILIEELLRRNCRLRYVPIDISRTMLEQCSRGAARRLPGALGARHGRRVPRRPARAAPQRAGARARALARLQRRQLRARRRGPLPARVRADLDRSDRFLIGIDLRKDRRTLEAAYDDARGVTARFNLNLLERINRELGGHFDLARLPPPRRVRRRGAAGSRSSSSASATRPCASTRSTSRCASPRASAIHTENSQQVLAARDRLAGRARRLRARAPVARPRRPFHAQPPAAGALRRTGGVTVRAVGRAGPIALALLSAAATARADVAVSALYGDGMVLQRDAPIVVRGVAEPGEELDVSLAQQHTTALATADGRWEVRLDSMEAGGPHVLRIAGASEILSFHDVLVGEVWVCAGQSNMGLTLGKAEGGAKEAARARRARVRLFQVRPNPSERVQQTVGGEWRKATPDEVETFSAVGWTFGRELADALDVPVGLIQCTVDGTPAEAWTERAVLQADPQLKRSLKRFARGEAAQPGALFNGMVAPLSTFGVRGVLWYQGEANVPVSHQYRYLFPALIRSWRAAWGDPGPFFLFVQLPGYGSPTEQPERSRWAELREAQAEALALPRTAMVVTIDLGEGDDIHPRNKLPVGHRAALAALSDVYGREDVAAGGPRFAGMTVEDGQVRVRFERVEGGLRAGTGKAPHGFALAGEDRQWHWASARIEGTDQVLVSSDEVPAPVAVRYAWADEPRADLTGGGGLPAAPFRSDDWPFDGPRGR